MILDIKKFEESLDEWVESPEGKVYFKNLEFKQVIQKKRYKRFEEWLKCNDFDKLMYRLIFEHNEDYREKSYYNGCTPSPNNKMTFLLNYVENNCSSIEVSKLDSYFLDDIRFFNGYYFQRIYCQGTITNVYNKEDLRLMLKI